MELINKNMYGICKEVALRVYKNNIPSTASRLFVGDIIKCIDFERGTYSSQFENVISVAWDKTHYKFKEENKEAAMAFDKTRATSPFLVCKIEFTRGDMPEDIGGESFIGIDVFCVRLTGDFVIKPNAEIIHFTIKNPMSVITPTSEINFSGVAELPIIWDNNT